MPYPDEFKGFAVHSSDTWTEFHLESTKPKPFGDYDIDIKIECCGVCGSDVHTIRGGWSPPPYPLVVGHEIVGKAIRIGPKVTSIKVGDRVGVGAQIYSCGECKLCKNDNENYCLEQRDTYGAIYPDGTLSQGGYSSHVRANERFTFPIPDGLKSEEVGPMLCAGLTSYSPLVRNGCGPGMKVAVAGLGGLGHFGIIWAAALGAEVTAISRSEKKKEDALKMGAHHYIATEKAGWAEEHHQEFDILLSSINMGGPDVGFDKYVSTVAFGGKFINIGLPEKPMEFSPFGFMSNNCTFQTTHIGSKKEVISMLDLALKKDLHPMVETIEISAKGCSEAVQRVQKNDVKYRFTLVGYDKVFGSGDESISA